MRFLLSLLPAVLLPVIALADEPLKWESPPKLVYDATAKRAVISFALNRPADVEMAIIDPKTNRVVRHLAGGVLGPTAPAPLAANANAQSIAWDGKDDFQTPVANPQSHVARVRAGMGVRLMKIAGGDPYAYYAEEIGHNDHSPFGISGLELKPDGKVYVLGHSSNLGPPALRQYDIDGKYQRTIFPAPAGKPVEAMQGWGIHVKADGSYTPRFNKLTDPSLTTTIMDTASNGGAGMPRLFPTPDKDRISVWRSSTGIGGFELLTFNADGTIDADPSVRQPGPLVKEPELNSGSQANEAVLIHSMLGPVFTCFSHDGKSFYLSGIHQGITRYGSTKSIPPEGTWRGGQVWKVDRATRTAKVFFALDEKEVAADIAQRMPAIGSGNSFSPLHGVAVDRDENVFVCDRLHSRVTVLDRRGKTIRKIPVKNPDAVAVSNRTGALYVTTRTGRHGARGNLTFLKFDDWRKSETPSQEIRVCGVGYTEHYNCSHLLVCETERATNIWVAHTELPVRIYRDDDRGFALLKDFYRVEGAQRCLGFDRIDVDPRTGEVLMTDNHSSVWKIEDWNTAKFTLLPIKTASFAFDQRGKYLYAHLGGGHSKLGLARFQSGGEYAAAPLAEGGSHLLTARIYSEWCFTGNGDLGFAVAANGNLAALDQRGNLLFFQGTAGELPWKETVLAKFSRLGGCVRFDREGNLYVGHIDSKPTIPLAGFQADRLHGNMARIHKFAPTGTLASGNLFPTAPAGPTKTYDVLFGAFEAECVVRSPRFSVDAYGRICYPTNIAQQVSLMDNAGNPILRFGTYGNRDSMGGLPGDLVPTAGIPLAFANSVAATDDHIYIGDMVNHRLLKIEKTFALTGETKP